MAQPSTLLVHVGPDDAALWNLPWEAKLLRRRQLESLLDDYSDLPDDDRVDLGAARRSCATWALICQATAGSSLRPWTTISSGAPNCLERLG